ncbi:MAG: c-type cytochrome [Geobacter sp.]|nr:c-type cytochrome [Geobacter sp.]
MSEKIEYDGISYREERKTPRFYTILFWTLHVWGAIFIAYYLLSGWSSEKELARIREAREAAAKVREAAVPPHPEADLQQYIATGKKLFADHCAVCHGPDAKGKIGPDLTRKDFTYGRHEDELAESITHGRPNGMPPFAAQLSHEQIEALVKYIHSL